MFFIASLSVLDAEKGWGLKAIGGLIVKLKGMPKIMADDIIGFDRYVDQEGELFLETTLDPEASIKRSWIMLVNSME